MQCFLSESAADPGDLIRTRQHSIDVEQSLHCSIFFLKDLQPARFALWTARRRMTSGADTVNQAVHPSGIGKLVAIAN